MENVRVRHRVQGYSGTAIGTTRIKSLFEDKNSTEEIRIQLGDGSIRIAPEHSLETIGPNQEHEFERTIEKRATCRVIKMIMNSNVSVQSPSSGFDAAVNAVKSCDFGLVASFLGTRYVGQRIIVDAINEGTIPTDCLVERTMWQAICRVRGRNFTDVDPYAWEELCRKRGYSQGRRNPRGF